MPTHNTHKVTELLRSWRDGNDSAAEGIFALVYDELRQQARFFLSGEREEHTLQPTALVHEAYLRMSEARVINAENRVHFLAIAARVMRQILVDHARKFNAVKRGGAARRLSVTDLEVIPEQSAADVLELNEALEKLAQLDQRKARVVDMRFFGGLSEAEIADLLGVSEKTIHRDWQFAKLWLLRELS